MKWLKKAGKALADAGGAIWATPARRYLLIAVLLASGVGTPAAVSIATAVDQGIDQIEQAERNGDQEETQE